MSNEDERAALLPTDAMIDAYLKANEEYWRETDAMPPVPHKWRTGNVKEATRVSLRAALTARAPKQTRPLLQRWLDWETGSRSPVILSFLKADTAAALSLSPTARARLPEPAFWVAQESKRHGMHPAYRSEQARLKYGGEGYWEPAYSSEQMRAALSQEPQP